MPFSPFTQTFDQLPVSLPIFPLSGAVVLPQGYLPVHIFEPHYVSMIRDTLKNNQLVGIIQPLDSDDEQALASVGTCARIVQFEETLEGQYNLVLQGVCRFNWLKELSTLNGYRMLMVDWASYKTDYQLEQIQDDHVMKALRQVISRYLDSVDADPKWKKLVGIMPSDQIISNAVCYLPLDAQDKQLLLEQTGLQARAESLITILEMGQVEKTRH